MTTKKRIVKPKKDTIDTISKRYNKMSKEEKQAFIFGMAVLTSVIINKFRQWIIEERIKTLK